MSCRTSRLLRVSVVKCVLEYSACYFVNIAFHLEESFGNSNLYVFPWDNLSLCNSISLIML